MAVTKMIGAIHPPSKGGKHKVLGNTIGYILNSQKTEHGLYVGSINCFPENALQTMIETQQQYGKGNQGFGKQERLGYHFVISFSKEEQVAPGLAFTVLQEFSETLLGKEYEAVYSVHTDKEHMHGHLCFNSVNAITGRKYRYENGDWEKIIQPITDKICKKYGLHTLEMDTGVSLEDYEKEQKEKKKKAYYKRKKYQENKVSKQHNYYKDSAERYSHNDFLRLLLDDIVLHSQTMEEFYQQLNEKGVRIKKGKSQVYGDYIGLKAPGMQVSRKTYQLGEEYTLAALEKRVQTKNKPMPSYQLPDNKILIIPMQHFTQVKKKSNLSPAMKRYFARLYRLGVCTRTVKLTYQDVKNARKKAEKIQRQLDIVLKYRIGSASSAEAALMECKVAYQSAKKALEQLQQKQKMEEKWMEENKLEWKSAKQKCRQALAKLEAAEEIEKEYREKSNPEQEELEEEQEQFYSSINVTGEPVVTIKEGKTR